MDPGQPRAFLETNTYMVGPMVWCEHRHRPWDCVAYTVAAYAGTLFERHQCTIEYGTYIRIISNCNPQELAMHAIWQRVARTRVTTTAAATILATLRQNLFLRILKTLLLLKTP